MKGINVTALPVGLTMSSKIHGDYGDFILIGRGIYALKEWGFSSGTVSDIIEAILKGKEQMSEDEIIDAVLEQRQVKPITIILNLKNKPQFVRVGRKRYTLKK